MLEHITYVRAVEKLQEALSKAPPLAGGAFPSPPDKRDFRYELLAAQLFNMEAPLPEFVSYKENLPPVFDQRHRGSCVAASFCWGVKPYYEINEGDYPGSGFSVAYVYTVAKKIDGRPDLEGTWIRAALEGAQKYGVAPEDDLPYETLTNLPPPKVPEVPPKAHGAAERYRIGTYTKLCFWDDPARDADVVDRIKHAIAYSGPVHAALLVCENFIGVRPPAYIIPKPEGRMLGGHAVALVGYDDKRQAFLLRNTWGEKWGDKGYAWLPYSWTTDCWYDPVGDGKQRVWCFYEAWTVTDVVQIRAAKTITITVGSNVATVDGEKVALDQGAFITDRNRMVVPLRFVGANMGYTIEWRPDLQTAVLRRIN
ncbi:MAG: C1 family peptidase [Armatimonadota bacterium]